MSDLATATKQVGEKRALSFVFSAELAPEATIQALLAFTIVSQKTVPEVLPLALITSTGLGTQAAKALFGDGTDGETYLITAKVACSDGQELYCPGLLLVENVTG